MGQMGAQNVHRIVKPHDMFRNCRACDGPFIFHPFDHLGTNKTTLNSNQPPRAHKHRATRFRKNLRPSCVHRVRARPIHVCTGFMIPRVHACLQSSCAM